MRQEKRYGAVLGLSHVLREQSCAARRLPSAVLDGIVRGLGDIRVDTRDVMSFNNGLAPIYRN